MPGSKSLSRDEKLELIAALEAKDRIRARTDCNFFVRHFLKTFDPRPTVAIHDIDFEPYDFQDAHIPEIISAIREGYDLFDEKSRDMGVSWLMLAVFFWMWLYDDGFQALLGSRKEEYVDNHTYKSLFGKLEYFIRTIRDPLLLPEGFDLSKHRTHMKLVNPENGNVIEGESSNQNFSRAGRYTVVFFDELGFWPDARNSWAAAGDATTCRIAVTTPPNEPSFAKYLRFSGLVKVITLHWRLHPDKDDAWYERQKKRRTEDEMLHEIDISWEYTSTGRPYPEVDRVEFGHFPYDPNAPLYAAMDLGLDAIACGWYQPVPNSDWMTLVDTFEISNEIIDWFLPLLGKPIDPRFVYKDDALEFIEMVKYWKPPIMYGDPSGNQRHVESGVSPYTIMKESGIYVQVNTLENDWPPRRDAAKKLLLRLRVNDTPRTRWWQECLKSARYPKRDPETSQSTSAIVKPVHDWTSHHRTQTEFMAVNYSPATPPRQRRRREYDPITGRPLN